MELPKRKQNRLPEYDYSTPNAYFITVCTNDRKNLFWTDVGAIIDRPENVPLTSLGLLARQAIRDIPTHYPAITVDHFVIMPNHIHLLLQINTDADGRSMIAPTISTVMRLMKGTVSKQAGFNGEKAVPYSARGIELEPRLKELLVKLEKDTDYVVAAAGSFKMQDLAVLTTETGVEFTALTIGGDSYLIRGYEQGTTIPRELIDLLIKEKGTFDYHSHPFIGDLRPSKEDKALLSMLTWQHESVIIDPNQSAMAFTVFGPKEAVSVKNEKAYSYWQELFGEGD